MNYPFKEEYQYYKLYKPYNVLSQFTPDHPGQVCLKDIIQVDKNIYPVGRLDKDSEGLLILTNDPGLNSWLLNPRSDKSKIYSVQLEGDITEKAISNLLNGINIRIKGKDHFVKAKKAYKLEIEPHLPERNPPIRYRANIPTSWCAIEISEGKNRQVRRMFAKVDFPVLRLVRTQIEDITIEGMDSGKIESIS